ncbi:MAG: biotin--[acetyl-CoA-carboxylase] ligase [Bacteroidales bacterium]|nr:biotin--[acetyl-CoA-carboxylase] ligase [Bacteroidales bacterium]
MQHLRYDILPSTNTFLMEKLRDESDKFADGSIVSAGFQGAGRGQVGNSWESAAGANALFSLALRNLQLPAAEHFCITQIVALALCESLCQQLPCFRSDDVAPKLRIKWPNDIYFGNKKLAGILIESRIFGGQIQDCICGIGLNVHQEIFLSDAPNPISLKQICQQHPESLKILSQLEMSTFIENIAQNILGQKEKFQQALLSREDIQNNYMKRLYRLMEWHHFQDEEASFEARIVDVLPDGRLQLEKKWSGELKNYAFKELRFVI